MCVSVTYMFMELLPRGYFINHNSVIPKYKPNSIVNACLYSQFELTKLGAVLIRVAIKKNDTYILKYCTNKHTMHN